MDSNGRFWILFWSLVAFSAVSIVITVSTYNYFSTKQMLKAGYVYKTVPKTRTYEGYWELKSEIEPGLKPELEPGLESESNQEVEYED